MISTLSGSLIHTGYYINRLLSFKKFCILPTEIISLNSIILVTEKQYASCAVITEFLMLFTWILDF
jgi:hypothetical protein